MKSLKIQNCVVTFYPYYSKFAGSDSTFFFELLHKSVNTCTYPLMQLSTGEDDNGVFVLNIDNFFLSTRFRINVEVINESLDLEKFTNNKICEKRNSVNVFMVDVQAVGKPKVFVIIDFYSAMAKKNKSAFHFCLFNAAGDSDFEIKDYWWSNFKQVFNLSGTHNKNWVYKYSALQKELYTHGLKDIKAIKSIIELTDYTKPFPKCVHSIFNYNKNYIYEQC